MSNFGKKIEAIETIQAKLEIKKSLLVDTALKSTSPSDILRAQKVLQNVERRESTDKKSYLIDPLDFTQNFGYKDKPFMLSYGTLKSMSKVPIINAIIKTRKNQIADFAEPQEDRYSTGFKIRKKIRIGEDESENTAEDWAMIEKIQNFIMNCGRSNSWENDDFETFIRKIVEDSLTYDQMAFEVVRDGRGELCEFFAVDASTIRIADSYDDDTYTGNRLAIKGYHPKYVQIYQGNVVNEYFPWELCFGVRNPSTSIQNNGYGVAEIEELVSNITSQLWAEEYNKKFFSQGATPKGMIKVKGNVNPKQLDAFRQEFSASVTGVANAWKTPVVEGEVDWIDLQKSNRDMEYSAWMDFLIKVSCAIFNIDPNEIGFDINKSAGEKSMFDSNNEGRLKHSKDKGLYPILKFIQRKLNKYIVSQIHPDYEFVFMGMNGLTVEQELEQNIKRLNSFQTLNEIRAIYKLDPVEGGDVVLNPTYTQNLAMKKQQDMMQQQGQGGNPFMPGSEDDFNDDDINPFLNGADMDDDDNPFVKAFINNLNK